MLRKIVYSVIAAHLVLLLVIAVAVKDKPSIEPVPIAVKTYTMPKPSPVKPRKMVKPKAEPKNLTRKKASDVMNDLQKNIAKLEKKKDNQKQAMQPAKKPKAKPQYPVLLVQKLKSALHLPEEGDVRLEVILKNSGEVIKVKVLSSKSSDNATYLQTEIPKMRFPVFSGELLGKKQHTFTLTFCHDD